ncbi:hypothetical protein Goshw_006140 [Gossypium schwendimanii]|uniref:RNase H type-1 domain-containing protein n=1 Tax=Gossypium schwendimanii TaxID=34291 RepID=A0A7J9NC71_GOSSC|nr:hypothetical protein [Gossypium schwendimanii]
MTMNHNLIFSDDPNYQHNTTSHPTTTNDNDSVSTGILWSADKIVKLSFSWAKQYTASYRRIPPKQQFLRSVVLENWFNLCSDDYLEAVKAIQVSSFDASNYALIRRVHQLLANIGVWGMQQISREFNKIADCMAKMAFDT